MARDRTKHFSESDIRNRIFDADGDFIYTSDIAMDIAVGNVAGATFVDKFGETGEDITEYDAEGNEIVPGVAKEAVFEEPKPTSDSTVAEIKIYLDAMNIPYTSKMLKSDLLALV